MLKKILLTSTALVFAFCTTKAQNQEQKEAMKQGIEQLTSIDNAYQILKSMVEGVERMKEISSIQGIRITSGDDAKDAEEKDDDNKPAASIIPANINSDSIKIQLADYLKENVFHQELTPPSSTISPTYSSSGGDEDIRKLIPDMNSSVYYIVNKLFYANGDVEDTSLWIEMDERNSLNDARFIDSMQVKLVAKYPTAIQHLSLSADNPMATNGNDTIKIGSIKGREAEIILSPNIYNNLIAIQGQDKKGQTMDTSSKNTSSLPSSETNTFFEKIGEEGKILMKNIDNKKYESLDALKKDMIDRFTAIEVPKGKQDFMAWVYFPKTIKQLDIYYGTALDSISLFKTIPNDALQSAETGYYVASDSIKEKLGIVDNLGNWIIKPEFDFLKHFDKMFFTGYKNEDNYTYRTYKLDAGAKTLNLYKYYVKDTILADNYIIGHTEDSDSLGVMDRNGNIIIPIAYSWIYSPEPGYLVAQTDKSILFDISGKELLPPDYSLIKVSDGYIYAQKESDSRGSIATIFDREMRQITKDNWDVQSIFADGSPLALVADENDNKFYINKQGEVAIPSSDKYIFAYGFESGLAIVYTEDANGKSKYGYVDENGKIVIDCQYDYAKDFDGDYASVEKDGKTMLITKDNKVYKILYSETE